MRAEAAKQAFDRAAPYPPPARSRAVQNCLAPVTGDIHDIGKNMLRFCWKIRYPSSKGRDVAPEVIWGLTPGGSARWLSRCDHHCPFMEEPSVCCTRKTHCGYGEARAARRYAESIGAITTPKRHGTSLAGGLRRSITDSFLSHFTGKIEKNTEEAA